MDSYQYKHNQIINAMHKRNRAIRERKEAHEQNKASRREQAMQNSLERAVYEARQSDAHRESDPNWQKLMSTLKSMGLA